MRKIVLVAVFALTLLFSILTSFEAAKAQDDWSAGNGDTNIIVYPINHGNYSTNLLTLKISFQTYLDADESIRVTGSYYFITYSIDGGAPVRIPGESITYILSHGILEPNTLRALVVLPLLSDGFHTLKVVAVEPYIVPAYTGNYSREGIVDFTVHTLPAITNVSIQNGTTAQGNVELSFNVDKQTSWLGYSLDNQSAISIYGNATLTGLASGPHSIIVYANSSYDDMATSEAVNFIVQTPLETPTPLQSEPTQTSPLLVPVLTVSFIAICVGSIIFVKKYQTKSTYAFLPKRFCGFMLYIRERGLARAGRVVPAFCGKHASSWNS